jgi:hypothetical protein
MMVPSEQAQVLAGPKKEGESFHTGGLSLMLLSFTRDHPCTIGIIQTRCEPRRVSFLIAKAAGEKT